MSTDVRILEPGQLERPLGEIRVLFLPGRDVFARRAERLRSLSKDHPLGDYLAFLAQLADTQQEVLNRYPTVSLADPDAQARRREQGVPLLDARSRQRDPEWRAGLTMILEQMSKVALPPAARDAVEGLLEARETLLEELANGIVAENLTDIPPQQLPFVAAALQVYWVHMASSLKEDEFDGLNQGGLCLVCGSSPNVGIVRSGGKEQGLRYLSCPLCSSQWHMVRIKCSSCESTEGIDYHMLEGSNGSVKTESCSACNFYLKLLYLAKDPRMDATADDLATLSLDMLMNNEGKARRGPNLFFHPGMV